MFYYENLKMLNESKGDFLDMITIDGVVGVGKSTLMSIFTEEKGYVAFEEPVSNNPILDKFYYDKKRYSFPLQIFFLNERFKHIKKASEHGRAVLDRSIYGDLIFAKMLKDSGEMSVEEFDIYLDLFHNMIQHCKAPSLMIYLEISPEEAMKRIAKRGREYEQSDVVDPEYWVNLNKEYQEYFGQYSFSPVLKINVDNLDFEHNPADRQYVMKLIDDKLIELGISK